MVPHELSAGRAFVQMAAGEYLTCMWWCRLQQSTCTRVGLRGQPYLPATLLRSLHISKAHAARHLAGRRYALLHALHE